MSRKKIWSRWWCQYGYPWNLMFILCRNHFSVLEGPLTIKNKCFQSIIYTHKTLENPLLKSFTIILIMIGDGARAVSGKSLDKCYKTWTLGCAKFSLIYLLKPWLWIWHDWSGKTFSWVALFQNLLLDVNSRKSNVIWSNCEILTADQARTHIEL